MWACTISVGRGLFKMKFRFCGDLDCPDWVLAEISTLAKLTSIKMKQLCLEVMKDILGGDINYEQVEKWTSAKFEESDIKAAIAALNFILSSAAKYGVDGESLDNELQQLGMPKENAAALCRVYAENLPKLQQRFQDLSLRVSKFESVDWRVDYLISSSTLQDIGEPCIRMKVSKRDPVTGAIVPTTFSISGDKFRVFLKDLKQAQQSMTNLS